MNGDLLLIVKWNEEIGVLLITSVSSKARFRKSLTAPTGLIQCCPLITKSYTTDLLFLCDTVLSVWLTGPYSQEEGSTCEPCNSTCLSPSFVIGYTK